MKLKDLTGMKFGNLTVIERAENSKGRWATLKEQANNRRNNIFIQIGDETHTIAEWSEISGVNKGTIRNRYKRGICGNLLLSKKYIKL